MRIPELKSRATLVVCAVLVLATLVFGAARLRPSSPVGTASPGQKNQKIKPVTSRADLPEIISKVKRLEVVSATVDEGGPNPVVHIEVRNKSDLGVTSLSISNGSVDGDSGESGIGFGLADPDIPYEVIPARATRTFDMPLANLDGKYPILLAGATFTDLSEEGDPGTLQSMRGIRQHDQKEKAKGVQP